MESCKSKKDILYQNDRIDLKNHFKKYLLFGQINLDINNCHRLNHALFGDVTRIWFFIVGQLYKQIEKERLCLKQSNTL